MVTGGALAGIAVSLLVSLLAPVALFTLARRRVALSWRNVAVGAGIFVLFALVLEQSLPFYFLHLNHVTAIWLRSHPLAFAFYGMLAAGLFEETGRFVGMRFFVTPTSNPGTALAYGIGHGGAESVIVGGLALAQLLAFALMTKAGTLDAFLGPRIPAAALAHLHATLAHLGIAMSLVSGLERLIALGAQIALSFIVWRSIETRRMALLLLAIALHMLIDGGAALFQAHIVRSVALAEMWALAGLGVTAFVASTLRGTSGVSAPDATHGSAN